MKSCIFLGGLLLLIGCHRTPDAPIVQSNAISQFPPSNPVSTCQGATIPWTTNGVSSHSGELSITIPNFDLSCGDNVRVFIQTITPVPGTPCVPGPIPGCVIYGPWSEIPNAHGTTVPDYGYFTLAGNVVTIQPTSVPTTSWNWTIEAILK